MKTPRARRLYIKLCKLLAQSNGPAPAGSALSLAVAACRAEYESEIARRA